MPASFTQEPGCSEGGDPCFVPLCHLTCTERAYAGGSTEPVESQKATKGVSPACEPPIEREGTPVSARKIAILGASELAIRTSLLKVAAIYRRGGTTSDVFFPLQHSSQTLSLRHRENRAVF